MRATRRQFSAMLAALGAGLIPSAVGGRASLGRSAVIVVGFASSAFAWMEHGKPKGIVLEAVDIVLTRLNAKPRYVQLPPGDLLQAINAGLVDMVATLPVEDACSFDLSPAMVEDWEVVATEAGREFPLQGLADLRGKTLGVRGQRPLALLDHAPEVTLHRFQRDADVLRELIHGGLDGMVVTAYHDVAELRAQGVLHRLRLLDHAVGRSPVSAALSRVRVAPDFIADFNASLEALMGSDRWPLLVEAAAPMEMARQWRLVHDDKP